MRKMLLILVLCVIWPRFQAGADSPVTTLGGMKTAVRDLTQLGSTDLLSDTTIETICGLALTRVSTEIGGIESQYRFITAKDSLYYLMPDTIVRVVSGEIMTSEGSLKGLRQFPPQYFPEVYELQRLGGEGPDDVPQAFTYWADTLQLLPAPSRAADTILLRCLVEHPYLTLDTNTIRLQSPFIDAAIQLACHLSLMSVRSYEDAGIWLQLYEKSKAELRQIYERPVEAVPGEVKK